MRVEMTDHFTRSYLTLPQLIQKAFGKQLGFYYPISSILRYERRSLIPKNEYGKLASPRDIASTSLSRETSSPFMRLRGMIRSRLAKVKIQDLSPNVQGTSQIDDLVV